MTGTRQLAVIMFTDIVGYTAMMQQDESAALLVMNKYKDSLQRNVGQFDGEIIQYFGDGGLMIFKNSNDAVSCAVSLQEDFLKGPEVPVRIGIHLGDIIYKEGNIFGDCVNITSRVESMGIPGAVLISESVQKQVKNQSAFKLVSLGKFEFKNVEGPMEIFALAINNFQVPRREDIQGKFKDHRRIKSIAVLPFVNMSNDPEQEYFGDGIAEEIINSLSHVQDLNVAGRTSSFQFKGRNMDLREAGAKLSVHHVLEGSVRKQGNRLRITAQLVNVADGYHLWSERYDREINDVFGIQDEIALAITEKLLITLMKKERELVTKSYTQNAEAYQLYLKGRFYLERRGASLITSLQCFQKAIELDPDFALAYTGHSDTNLLLATYGLVSPDKVMPQAKRSAERALELDPTLCQPYCSLGYYYAFYDWNWTEAKKNFLRSLDLNPKYADGHFRYGMNYLACVEGDFSEAAEHGETAIKLEPLSSICYANYALILHAAGKFSEALKLCQAGIELDANSFICHIAAVKTQLAMGQIEAATSSYESAMRLTNRHSFAVNAQIWTYCAKGETEKARNLMNELKERSGTEYIAKTFTGISAAYLGDLDEAFHFLEKAYLERDPILMIIKYEACIPQALRSDPRFQKLLDKIGFPN